MTEFDVKLNGKLHEYKMKSDKAIYKIANECGIHEKRLYAFTSGKRSLNGEDVGKLLDYLGLTVELKEEK